ncbi:MAG: Crp/Fnr family transcriptional regulator [Spirochaetes bacterium]|nr:Crp/Fnr family transcriptional regulator [Spirochaetota bacterium]
MPQARTYKKGSIIYFDGEAKNNFAFLLKSGVCSRIKLSPESVQPERSRLVVGEFFGIKAALGVLPRDETIQVDADSVVFIFTPKEFEDVIKKNLSIIFKMLRAFSNELRRIHTSIESFLHTDGDAESNDPAARLLAIGNYYFNSKQYKPARYAFEKYLEHYADASGVSEAKDQLETIRQVLENRGEEESGEAPAAAEAEAPETESAPAYADDSGETPMDEPPPSKPAPASFQLFETKESYDVEKGDQTIHKAWGEIAFIFAKKEWAKADAAIARVVDALKGQTPAGSLFEKLFLARARLKFYLKDYEACTSLAKEFVKNYKGSRWTWHAMVCIGECYRAQDQLDHAKAVYGKIAASATDEDLKAKASERLAEMEG